MGKFIYGSMPQEIDVDDRTLAHLQAVVATKLRRGEGFFLNWRDDQSIGGGHSAAWIGPNVPIFFKYHGSKQIELSRQWLEVMTQGANSNGGLHLGEEPPLTAPVAI
jgi:hypothetical protein